VKISEISVAPSAEAGRSRLVVRSDSGLYGVSEFAEVDGRDGVEGVAPRLRDLLVGREPFDVEALWAAGVEGDSGVDPTLVAAATSAMLDLAAKGLDAPACQLLGGAVHDAVRACAIGWADEATGRDEVVTAARRTAASGYTLLRVEPFAITRTGRSNDLTAATTLIRAIRDAVPDEVDLVVATGDATAHGTAEFIEAVAAAEALWVEVPNVESSTNSDGGGHDAVARAMGRGADGDMLRRLVIDNVVDHLVLEVDRIGGILEARRIAALAEIFYIGVITACAAGALPLRDTLCLAAAVPNLSAVEVRPGLVSVEDGMVALDTSPPSFDLSGIGG
jgi:galactonate dehydratase